MAAETVKIEVNGNDSNWTDYSQWREIGIILHRKGLTKRCDKEFESNFPDFIGHSRSIVRLPAIYPRDCREDHVVLVADQYPAHISEPPLAMAKSHPRPKRRNCPLPFARHKYKWKYESDGASNVR
jgi:hypothetical protein